MLLYCLVGSHMFATSYKNIVVRFAHLLFLWTHGESNPGLVHAMDVCYHYTMGPIFQFYRVAVWEALATLKIYQIPAKLRSMFKDLLIKKMLKRQGLSDEQINQLLEIVNKNPELFKRIAEETQSRIKNGEGQTEASMAVMKKYEAELRKLKQP